MWYRAVFIVMAFLHCSESVLLVWVIMLLGLSSIGCSLVCVLPRVIIIYIRSTKILFAFLEHGVLKGWLEVVMLGLVEPIHIQLSHKTVHLIMPEIFRQDNLFKLCHILYRKLCSVRWPVDDLYKIVYLLYSKNYTQDLKCLGYKSCHLLLVLVNVLGLALALHGLLSDAKIINRFYCCLFIILTDISFRFIYFKPSNNQRYLLVQGLAWKNLKLWSDCIYFWVLFRALFLNLSFFFNDRFCLQWDPGFTMDRSQ